MSTADGDRIEREIHIDAPIERVWRLVSEPGWWIGDGDPSRRTVTRDGDGDVVVVEYPPFGRFPIMPVAADAPRFVSFRGSDTPTLLRVVESGFVALYPPGERRAAAVEEEDNIGGWEFQLGVARRDAGRASV